MSTRDWDQDAIRRDFPILRREVNGKPLVYLDNAATSQKPVQVIAELTRYYRDYNANIHRGVHTLSQEATAAYEGARARVAAFIGARAPEEIVFTRNATEAINLVAHSYGRAFLEAGDEVVITELEHHSNIVPWQLLRDQHGVVLRYVPMCDDGTLDMAEARRIIGPRTKLLAITQMSNALGTIVPVAELAALAHQHGAVVLVDGAQSVPHLPTDVAALGADFLVFSAHKMLGPTGVGVLWARSELLEAMPPFLAGGDMILTVSMERSTWNAVPYKFEAGTPNIAGAVGLHAALDYLDGLGRARIHTQVQDVTTYACERLREFPGVRLFGPQGERGGLVSFVLPDVHALDLATMADQQGVAIRVGHHCTQPLHDKLGVPATARASFYFYNTRAEVDRFVTVLRRVIQMIKGTP